MCIQHKEKNNKRVIVYFIFINNLNKCVMYRYKTKQISEHIAHKNNYTHGESQLTNS